MRQCVIGGLALVTMTAADASAQAANLDIGDVAAKIVVVTEPRADVVASVIKTNPRLPLIITRQGDGLSIRGSIKQTWWSGLFHRQLISCKFDARGASVGVMGIGGFHEADLPLVLVRAPLDAKISTAGGVVGSLPTADSLALEVKGCDSWTIGRIKGRMTLNDSGVVRLRVGSAGAMTTQVAGSGDVAIGAVTDGLQVEQAGVGQFRAGRVSGPVSVQVSGQGNVRILGGHASDLSVTIAGVGQVIYGGLADTLEATIAGEGEVEVAQVLGPVQKTVAGVGKIVVGGMGPPVGASSPPLGRGH